MNKCIICFDINNLIKPCNCNYYVHQKCFDKWNNNCLYCKKKIKKKISCYTILRKSILFCYNKLQNSIFKNNLYYNDDYNYTNNIIHYLYIRYLQ